MAKAKQPLTRDELLALSNKQIAADLASTLYKQEQVRLLERATIPTTEQRKQARQLQEDARVAQRIQHDKDRQAWDALHKVVKTPAEAKPNGETPPLKRTPYDWNDTPRTAPGQR